MAEVKNMALAAVSMVLLAIITLVGYAIVGGFDPVLRLETNTSIQNLNLSVTGKSVVGASGTYPFLQDLDVCINATENWGVRNLTSAEYTVNEGTDTGGSITLTAAANASWAYFTVNCSTIKYLAATTASNSADDFQAGMAIFAVFSAVIALGIVGKIIIGLFQKE